MHDSVLVAIVVIIILALWASHQQRIPTSTPTLP
jgi:hypothetical protein